MGGYPPGLPPLQGPVDGLVSMGSMQPLHPGGPPPHHLPPGVPGLPGIPPPGKNFILIHSLISFFYSFSSLSQFFQEAPAAHGGQASLTKNPRAVSSRAHPTCWTGDLLYYLCPCASATWQQHRMHCRGQTHRPRSRRRDSLSDRICLKSLEGHSLLSVNCQFRVIYKSTFYSEYISSPGEILTSQGLHYRVPAPSLPQQPFKGDHRMAYVKLFRNPLLCNKM